MKEGIKMSIYSLNRSNSEIRLFGEEADNFLQNNGISLFENCIVLEGEQADAYKARKEKEAEEKAKAEKDRDARRYGDSSTTGKTGADDDKARADKAKAMAKAEADKRFDGLKKTMDERQKTDREFEEKHPNGRPTGMFKGKEKKEYDKDYADYEKKLDKHDKDFEDAKGKMFKYGDKKKVEDAANRHMRRHPEQYKESGIFSDVKII